MTAYYIILGTITALAIAGIAWALHVSGDNLSWLEPRPDQGAPREDAFHARDTIEDRARR